jgi:apolipoprotein D and lipocalin family protein
MRALLLTLLALTLAACSSAPTRESGSRQAAAQVDRERFMGRWYILANVPYFAERDKVASYVEYVPRADGKVDDLYHFRETLDGPEKRWEGVAWALDERGSRWRARFIWPFSTEFWVLHTDDKVAVVATPDAKLGWIYARTTTLDAAVYEDAVRRLAAFGVDTGKLVRIPHLPPAKD